jgi:sulfoxide reductase heme-binding subunit YedZ
VSRATPANYVWWLAGRSAGVVALILITASVLLGLAMAARVIPARHRRGAARLHQPLALVALAAIAAHGILLAADPWLKAGPRGILLPFALGYRPLWTGLGIISGYLAAVLAFSFYVRRRIGTRVWRQMHRLTVLVYVLGVVHTLGAGTDASIPLVRYVVLGSVLPVLFLFALRMQLRGPRPRAARPADQPVPLMGVSAAAVERSAASIAPATGSWQQGASQASASSTG